MTLIPLFSFLADREHQDSDEFRKFRRNLFHGSLREILGTLRPGMEVPEIIRFADGYYRRAIYGVGPYIADYPEQVLCTCIVQGWCPRCNARWDNLDGEGGRRIHELSLALLDTLDKKALWDDYGIVSEIMVCSFQIVLWCQAYSSLQPFTYGFPCADIHELISPDILHQVIKGTFKDHLVTWVEEYLKLIHGSTGAQRILADIDRRYDFFVLFQYAVPLMNN